MTKNISNAQIQSLAKKVINLILIGNKKEAVKSLKSLLDKKCPFPKLDLLGKEIGLATVKEPEKAFKSFDAIIDYKALGSFVIVATALPYFFKNNFKTVIKKSREYIIQGDEWYFSDTIGHRTLGQALADYFDKTLPWLEKFLQDENKWVRKSVGIAIHMFLYRNFNPKLKFLKIPNSKSQIPNNTKILMTKIPNV